MSRNEIMVKYLSEIGEEINRENIYVFTLPPSPLLFNSCFKENEAVVKYLVEHGADINKEDKDGATLLFYTWMEIELQLNI